MAHTSLRRQITAIVAGFVLSWVAGSASAQDGELGLIGTWESLPKGNSLADWKVPG